MSDSKGLIQQVKDMGQQLVTLQMNIGGIEERLKGSGGVSEDVYARRLIAELQGVLKKLQVQMPAVQDRITALEMHAQWAGPIKLKGTNPIYYGDKLSFQMKLAATQKRLLRHLRSAGKTQVAKELHRAKKVVLMALFPGNAEPSPGRAALEARALSALGNKEVVIVFIKKPGDEDLLGVDAFTTLTLAEDAIIPDWEKTDQGHQQQVIDIYNLLFT